MITKKSSNVNELLYIGLAVVTGMLIGLWFIFGDALAGWHLAHDPIHASMEVVGSIAALMVAFVLLQQNEDDRYKDLFMVTVGFIGMGILDGFHGLTKPGVAFVFLHSVASLVGGFFFALVWLPGSLYEESKNSIITFTVIVSLLVGTASVIFPELLPAMVSEGEFTNTAIGINFVAGILFLFAMPRFVIRYNETGYLEYFLFLSLTLLFGLAELTFQFSTLWDGSWWLWHLFRLLAYGITFWFVANWYLQTSTQIRASRDSLEKTVEERTFALQQSRDRLQETVEQYTTFAEKVAKGDLTARLTINGRSDVTDETLGLLGQHLNRMTERLQEMIMELQEATINISSASAEILAATTQQASGANEQSTAIKQTTETINEVKAIVEQAYGKAERVAQQTHQTTEISNSGQLAVDEAITSMSQIKEKVAGIAENILALSEQTQRIGEITSTVNEIAAQSNLLALNASVEAARAGEHGKGFAVVAVEVRNLAEQSRQATAQVKTILNEIQKATNAAVMATEEGIKGVDVGVELTERTGSTIQSLSQSITDNTNSAQQIVASTQQQTSGIEQIALAIHNINQAMMQSLASAQQTKRSAQDLNDVSQQLEQIVNRYKLK